MREGLDLLRAAVSDADAADSETLGRFLVETVGNHPEDDIAVLVLRVPPPSSGDAGRATGLQRRRLDRSGHAPRQARAFATEWLHAVPDAPRAAALLVVSELVTNAVRHGNGDIGVELATVDGRVRITVDDDSRGVPQIVDARPEGGGRGLHIVDQLADWGWEPTSRGKAVWALLRPPAVES
jgi:signal transduction histidine kinase